MLLLEMGGVALCIGLNMLVSQKGHGMKQDKELFIPPTSVLFIFYPIIIALPEAHYKLINYSFKNDKSAIDEDELFPYAFLISLVSITVSTILDKFLLSGQDPSEEESGLNKQGEGWAKHKNSLQFLLTLSIALQNVVNYYYICI